MNSDSTEPRSYRCFGIIHVRIDINSMCKLWEIEFDSRINKYSRRL